MSLAAATDNCRLCKREPATVTRLGLPFCQGCLEWKTATLHRGDPRVDVRAAELEAQSAELLAEARRTLAAAEARRMYGCGCGVTECPGHLGATERAPRGRMDVLGANPLDRSETP